MIADPHNDHACLSAITEEMIARVTDRDPQIAAVADAHADTAELAAWLRSLPQRDDEGRPDDGPKVEACEPAQRLRVPADDPNCVERAALYVAAAELIDPGPMRQLATARTPGGLHTYPLEDGEPVVLDPLVSRNALMADLFRSTQARNGDGSIAIAPRELIDWLADIAREPAGRFPRGEDRVRHGHGALCGLLGGRPLCIADVRDVAFVLALADRESRLWGAAGPRLVATAARAVDRLDQDAAGRAHAGTCTAKPPIEQRNAPEIAIRGLHLRPDLSILGALGRVGGRIGYTAGLEALRLKLATLGLSPPVLAAMDRELQREGLSLGPLAQPAPMLGSLAALTPQAIAGRWLASKL